MLLAGTFESDFARNRVIAALLERAGYEVSILRRDLWGQDRYLLLDRPKLALAVRALRVYTSLLWALARADRPDVIVVLYPGYFDVPVIAAVARLRRIPILFDTFISLYDTVVTDRGLRSPTSLVGRLARFVDKVACRLADVVLADTPVHADFLAELTGVESRRFRVLWLGAREDVFRPILDVVPEPDLVLFHGTFIPLQGIETIVRTVKLLDGEGVRVRLVGDGQDRPRAERLAEELGVRSLEFVGRLPLEQLPREIASASVCLGIFGTTSKADRVVPNKVFECLAMGRPVITADTAAMRSAFAGEVELVPAGDPEALAAAIRALLRDKSRLLSLGVAGRQRFERDYGAAALARLLARYLDELLQEPV